MPEIVSTPDGTGEDRDDIIELTHEEETLLRALANKPTYEDTPGNQRILDSLVEEGLIKRISGEDDDGNRVEGVQLTTSGKLLTGLISL